MVLNRIWIGMFLISIIVAGCKLIFWQDVDLMKNMIDSLSGSAKTAFEYALFLTGTMCLWLGVMKIGENSGALKGLTRFRITSYNVCYTKLLRNDHIMDMTFLEAGSGDPDKFCLLSQFFYVSGTNVSHAGTQAADKLVITSYSIHYTKLYEHC